VPVNFTSLDLLALAVFLVGWVGYNFTFDRWLARRSGLNQNLKTLRLHWMRRLLERENRISDAALVGHTIHSTSFLGSATLLLLAALVGVLGNVESIWRLVGELSFAAPISKTLFEAKLFLLIGIFVFGFLKFTWALRQFNYFCAMIGSAPPPNAPPELREHAASHMATLLTLAVTSFNGGLRAYYFALAALTWLAGPIFFIAATVAVVFVLLRRQFLSRTAETVIAEVGLLGS
jgi:uncharacterized membrane protein